MYAKLSARMVIQESPVLPGHVTFYIRKCKTKVPGEKGPPRNHLEISSQKLADFECRLPIYSKKYQDVTEMKNVTKLKFKTTFLVTYTSFFLFASTYWGDFVPTGPVLDQGCVCTSR